MASFGHNSASQISTSQLSLPKLYKFALVLTANEQLARGLLRGAAGLASRSQKRGTNRDDHLDIMHKMYGMWMSKLAEDAGLQQKYPPEPRLFANAPVKGVAQGNAHFAKFIANLPPQQRAVLYLIYGERTSYDEAAEIVSLNMLALMKLLARGHAALAHWLDHRGIQQPGQDRDGELSPALSTERAA